MMSRCGPRGRSIGLWILALCVVSPMVEKRWLGTPFLTALWAPIECASELIRSPLFLVFAIPLTLVRLLTTGWWFALADRVIDRLEGRTLARPDRMAGLRRQETGIVPALVPHGRGDEVSAGPAQCPLVEAPLGRRAEMGEACRRVVLWLFRVAALVVSLYVLFVFIAGGRILFMVIREVRPHPLNNVSEITRALRVQFPESAVLLDSEYVGGLSRNLIARIHLPHCDVRKFLAQPIFNGEASREDRGWFPGSLTEMMNRRGWHPERVRRFLHASGQAPNRAPGGWVEALIDLDDPSAAVLYVYYQD